MGFDIFCNFSSEVEEINGVFHLLWQVSITPIGCITDVAEMMQSALREVKERMCEVIIGVYPEDRERVTRDVHFHVRHSGCSEGEDFSWEQDGAEHSLNGCPLDLESRFTCTVLCFPR